MDALVTKWIDTFSLSPYWLQFSRTQLKNLTNLMTNGDSAQSKLQMQTRHTTK